MYKSGLHSMVYITAPTVELAKTLARGIIERDLAACVNLVPQVLSVYKWEGEVNEDTETMMVIKTRTSRIEDLINYVEPNHPYKVCEIISTKIENGNKAYLDWMSSAVSE